MKKPEKIDSWTGKQFDLEEVERDLLLVSLERANDLLERANEIMAHANEVMKLAQDVKRQAAFKALHHASKRIGLEEPRNVEWKIGEGGIPTGFKILPQAEAKPKKPLKAEKKAQKNVTPIPSGT